MLVPLSALFIGPWTAHITAQAPSPSSPATCRISLDSLDAKVRENYAGHLLEVTGSRQDAHRAMLQRLRNRADTVPLHACYPVLASYVQWYDDPHLFVFQSTTPDSSTARRRAAALRHVRTTETDIRRALTRRATHDPIEGIWFDGPLQLGVIPDPAGPSGSFVAVVLRSDTTAWPVGTVRAELRRVRNDAGPTSGIRAGVPAYDMRLLTRHFGETYLLAKLYRGDLLRLSPGVWGRAHPAQRSRAGMLDSVDAHRPTVVVRERSVVFSIPSHDPQFTPRLDSLVAANADAIRSRPLLIIDLRGNEGGGSGTTRALDPYIASTTRRVTPYDSGTPVMLASPAQLAYARRIVGGDTSATTRRILQRLESETGALVPLEGLPSPLAPEPSTPGDWRVVVLVDAGTVSASEVLVLKALRSTRATVVGQPTAGALDYQSTQGLSLGTGDRQWALGYPTITAHADLPRRGMRGKGIAPEVVIRWEEVPDAIVEVERRFAR
ncbi:S41 family peptidase [Gemmatimonas aurantiaca]|uniref:S41 family peptidase n=1 Tax=Gemmatimonas aurantiaca TaxID=173480 RepID=UPI00301BF84D